MAAPKWNVMVFMADEPDPAAIDLTPQAQAAITQMESVGSGESLNIFFQLHGKGIPQRCHVQKPGKAQRRIDVSEPERDATNGNALLAFIDWAFDQADPDPGDYSMLVLWGHAYQFAFGHAMTGDGIDGIDFAELAAVFERYQAGSTAADAEHPRKVRKGGRRRKKLKLDVIGFDACDLATIEVCYQLFPFADYLVASEIGIPLPGWPYQSILKRIRVPKGRLMDPAELGSYIVRRYCEEYHLQDRAVSLSVLDLSAAPQLLGLTEQLSRSLALAVGADSQELEAVRRLFFQSQTAAGRPFVDVADLCESLSRNCSDAAVGQAAAALGDVLISPGLVTPGHGAAGSGRRFVIEHGSNGSATARLHGVSLYAPHVAADNHDFEASSPWYEKFDFAHQTIWTDLVRAFAQSPAQ